ncbi:hypothetical protein [Chryseobacterium daeguense]|uniref:hypothetical protein n=1 Tax=Chryseobacterium daeguense TaxID=412438 RepID=UPI0004091394|nr:hypothetical protein [Chryseobacterium daeguense]
MTENSTRLWNQFIIIENFRRFPLLSTLLTGYNGENLIGYTYIDHEEGITLDILKLFTEDNGDFNISKDLEADKSRAIIRFEDFYETDFQLAEDEMVKKLGARIPAYLESYRRDDLKSFREEKDYDKFRTPGFPDDIQIFLINNKNTPELIWARVENYNPETKIGVSKLIVEPHQNFNLNIFDNLLFKLMEINGQPYPVAIIENKPEKKWWKFW